MTVNLTNVNDAPAPSGGPFSIAENSANGTDVGTPVAATDPDAGQTHTCAITAGNTGGAFAIDAPPARSPSPTPRRSTSRPRPPSPSRCRPPTTAAPVLTGIDHRHRQPHQRERGAGALGAATFSIAENSANGTDVGTPWRPTIPTPGQTHTCAITAGNTGGAFAINSSPARSRSPTAAALDFETTPDVQPDRQATDNGTPVLSGTGTVTVNLTNVNEAPAPTRRSVLDRREQRQRHERRHAGRRHRSGHRADPHLGDHRRQHRRRLRHRQLPARSRSPTAPRSTSRPTRPSA